MTTRNTGGVEIQTLLMLVNMIIMTVMLIMYELYACMLMFVLNPGNKYNVLCPTGFIIYDICSALNKVIYICRLQYTNETTYTHVEITRMGTEPEVIC